MDDERNASRHDKQEGDRGFFELYGISDEEEAFFRTIYQRRIVYRAIIAVLIAVVIAETSALLLWL